MCGTTTCELLKNIKKNLLSVCTFTTTPTATPAAAATADAVGAAGGAASEALAAVAAAAEPVLSFLGGLLCLINFWRGEERPHPRNPTPEAPPGPRLPHQFKKVAMDIASGH